MKNLLCSLFLFTTFLFSNSVSAQKTPDTIHVISQNKDHLAYYGSYNAWAVFPPDTNSYRKVLLNFTLGCPSGGCSQWDYTVDIFLNHNTHIVDSNKTQSPSFTVNGATKDSIYVKKDTTYTTAYNKTTHKTDSTANAFLTIVQFKDSTHPTTPSDTLKWWLAGYYNFYYDTTGHKIDSIYIKSDTIMYAKFYHYYHKYDSIESYEIARMITPYAGYYAKTWTHPYTFDVTDFSSLMNDSVQINVFYSGWSDGFTATCDFEMITGTPPRTPYKTKLMWTGSFPYGNTSNPISNYLVPTPVKIDSAANAVRLRVLQTGHGEDMNNCTEFCANYNHISVNSKQEYSTYVWKDDCGMNPLYHQAGTWLYNRANWCPGEQITPYIYDLTPYVYPGKTDTILMSMDPYAPSSYGGSIYTIGASLIYYGPINKVLDASIEDIQAPTSNPYYGRYNPICDSPKVVLMNTGSTPLTSCDITYGQQGGTLGTFHWTGNLLFGDTAVVQLPQVSLTGGTANIFTAKVSNPNGGTDQNPDNDYMQTPYTIVPNFLADFIIKLTTNHYGADYTYTLTDDLGNVITQGSGFGNNKTYKDTVHLGVGCYRFVINSANGEGLSYWADTALGTGALSFTKIPYPGAIFLNFQPDFGTSLVQCFSVNTPSSVKDITGGVIDYKVFPNPAKDEITISGLNVSDKAKNVKIISTMGQVVYEAKIPSTAINYNINLTNFAVGLYCITISNEDGQVVKKVMVSR